MGYRPRARTHDLLRGEPVEETKAIPRVRRGEKGAAANELGFFFTPREKSSLYLEDFADILSRDGGDDSFEPYYREMRHAGNQEMLWLDLMTYLPDDILTKIDRTSMACSLEVRAPLLDHEVVEFMARIPLGMKVGTTNSKILLRKLAQRYVPDGILKRPKQGFAIPLATWIQNELRTWVEECLLSSKAAIIDPRSVRRMLKDHLDSRRDFSQQLWALVILELWLQQH